MIAEIIARLVDTKAATGLRQIGGAPEFQVAAETKPLATPAAYVITLEESPGDNAWEGEIVQEVRLLVGIVLVVKNVADAKGAAAQADMEVLRKLVKAQLFGYASGIYDPLLRGPSRPLAFADGHMWWQDAYHTTYHDRSQL